MSARIHSPAQIGEILECNPDVLRRVVFLAAEVRQRQRAYYRDRSAPNALELLVAAKDHERRLDLAIAALCEQKGLDL